MTLSAQAASVNQLKDSPRPFLPAPLARDVAVLIMEVELLISKVFERAPLWDKRDKQHANRNVIDKLWKEVSKELDCEGKNIKYLLFMQCR